MSLENAILALAEAIRYAADKGVAVPTQAITETTTKAKTAAPVETDETVEATPEPEKKPAAKKKTAAKKKPKPEPEEVEEADDVTDEPEEVEEVEEVEEADEAPEDADASYDTDDIRRAAMSVRDEVGREALATALKAFKAKKISELKEENFGAFIRHCENLIESGSAE